MYFCREWSGLHPLGDAGRCVVADLGEQGLCLVVDDQHVAIGLAHEAFVYGVVEKLDQLVVVAGGVEQGAGFLVVAELAPGPDLEQLFKGADAAGQGDKAVRQVGHHGLALVHGADFVQGGQAFVGQFALDQVAREQKLSDGLVWVVVGDATVVEPQLEQLGLAVERIEMAGTD